MVTKLQYIANQVAEENISTNPRLRNEEIRRRMYGDWQEPVIQPEEAPGGLQDATKQDTLAKTYSALKNNYNYVTRGSSLNSTAGQGDTFDRTASPSSAPLSGTPSWLPSAVGYGLSAIGEGQWAGLGAGATQLMQGNRAGAVGTLSNIFTNHITKGNIPGLGGMVGTLASGLVGNKSEKQIGQDMLNSGIGTLVSMTNPVAGIVYSLARNLGFNPAYGLNNLFGDGLNGVAPGYEGTLGGFFGKNALGTGIKSTPSNITNAGFSSSGGSSSSSYTPPGFSSGDLGSGITNTGGTGIRGGISTPSYSWGTSNSESSSSYSDSPSYSYSNPASSYGSW